jgi:hypothetical protein
MKKVILVLALVFIGNIAVAQTTKAKEEPKQEVKAPKLPDGIEKGLSITYNEIGELIFVTKKKSIYDDIEKIKEYIGANYRLYNASAPEIEREGNKWIITFKKR